MGNVCRLAKVAVEITSDVARQARHTRAHKMPNKNREVRNWAKNALRFAGAQFLAPLKARAAGHYLVGGWTIFSFIH